MFEQVKQEIDDKIKTNGSNEITATRLNGVLQDMMDATEEELNGYVQKTDTPSPAEGDIVVFDEYGGFGTSEKTVNDFATAAQGAKADTALQPTGVKTINNQSIVGSGNITIEGGGTDDYVDLDNKPQINSIVLSGNKSTSDLGLATAEQGAKADTAVQPSALNNYVQKSQTTGLLKNNGTVDTQTVGKAASALQPISGATENNFAAFDANGGIKDSLKNASNFATSEQGTKADNAIPMPTGTDGYILEKDSNVTAGVKWVEKPTNGKSAYQIWYEENGYSDPTTYNEEYFLASLKAQFGSFVPTDYGTDGKPASGGTDITASANTTNYIYLVDNLSSNPTAKVMWITVVDETDPSNPTYSWQNIGEVQVSLLFKSGQSLDDVNIVNDLTTGGVNDVLSAEQGKVLDQQIDDLDLYLNGGKKYYADLTVIANNDWISASNVVSNLSEPTNSFKCKFTTPETGITQFQMYVWDENATRYSIGPFAPNTEFVVTKNYNITRVAVSSVSPDVRYTGTFKLEVYNIVTSVLDSKMDKTAIKQAKGTSTTDVMSQKVVTDELNSMRKLLVDSNTAWLDDVYIRYADGTTGGSPYYKSTPFVGVPSGCKLIIATSNNSDIVGVAFYDENFVYISGEPLVFDHSYVGEFTIDVPENAFYIRYTCFASNYADSYAYVRNGVEKSVVKLQKDIKPILTNWAFALDKILCIGDSLTSGAYYDGSTFNGASIAQNYPYYLGRILNTPVVNAGVSGISVKGWYDDESDKYTYTDYNAIIIWLGSNYGLLKDLPDNPTEGQIKAHENFVAYGQLIDKIQTANPNAQIVLCKIYFTNYWVDISNNGIAYYAEQYGLPIIDLSDLNAETHPELRYVNANQYHLIKCGNITVATRIIQGITEWISENPQRCEFGLSPRVY